MNPFMKQFITALRSGKYPQVRFTLRDENGYCASGVACDVYDPSEWGSTDLDTRMSYDNSFFSMPPHVEEALGMKMDDSYIRNAEGKILCWNDGPYPLRVGSLVRLNDDYQLTFDQIADLLEWTYSK